jgi:hypothetical protein
MEGTKERFLAQLAAVDAEQARAMRLAWDLEDPAPREATWQAAMAALRAAGRSSEVDRLRDDVNAWVGGTGSSVLDLVAAHSDAREAQHARAGALPPVLDAGLAAIAGDVLDQDQRYALMKPWQAGLTGQTGRPRRVGRRPRASVGRR